MFVMHLNLRVYLIVSVFIGCVYSLIRRSSVFLYLPILVIFFKCSLCILICKCTCLFLSSLWKYCTVFLLCLLILIMFMFVLCFVIEVLFSFLYLLGRKEFLFIDSFRWESLSRWCTLKRDNGQACSSVTMDRQHLCTHLRPILGICLLTWGLQPYSGFPTTFAFASMSTFRSLYVLCMRSIFTLSLSFSLPWII